MLKTIFTRNRAIFYGFFVLLMALTMTISVLTPHTQVARWSALFKGMTKTAPKAVPISPKAVKPKEFNGFGLKGPWPKPIIESIGITCPDCNGTGKKESFFGSYDCSTCNGTGRKSRRY